MTTLNQALRTLNQREATRAALTNEQLTRQRVEKLEQWLHAVSQEQQALRRGGMWTRLRWLVTGKS